MSRQQNRIVIVAWEGILELAHLLWITYSRAAWASNQAIHPPENPQKVLWQLNLEIRKIGKT